MGMFTSVIKDARCKRCNIKTPFEFQFKTGHDDCARYANGQRTKGLGLVYGTYEASRNNLCEDCTDFIREWHRWIGERTFEIVLRQSDKLSYVSRRYGFGSRALLWKTIAIATVRSGGISTETPNHKIVKRLFTIVPEFWMRQARIANTVRQIEINNETKPGMSGLHRSFRQLILKNYDHSCRVKVDKRIIVVKGGNL